MRTASRCRLRRREDQAADVSFACSSQHHGLRKLVITRKSELGMGTDCRVVRSGVGFDE